MSLHASGYYPGCRRSRVVRSATVQEATMAKSIDPQEQREKAEATVSLTLLGLSGLYDQDLHHCTFILTMLRCTANDLRCLDSSAC